MSRSSSSTSGYSSGSTSDQNSPADSPIPAPGPQVEDELIQLEEQFIHYFQNGMYDFAAQLALEAINSPSKYKITYKWHVNLGLCYDRIGLAEDASQEYYKAVQMEPQRIKNRHLYASTLFQLKQYLKAEIEFNDILKLLEQIENEPQNMHLIELNSALIQDEETFINYRGTVMNKLEMIRKEGLIHHGYTDEGIVEKALADSKDLAEALVVATMIKLGMDHEKRHQVEEDVLFDRGLSKFDWGTD